MEYERLRPQMVKHSSGTIIQFSGRYNLQVIYPDGKIADIEVDDAEEMAVFKKSLTSWKVSDKRISMSEDEKKEIIRLIEGALPLMGVRYVLIG